MANRSVRVPAVLASMALILLAAVTTGLADTVTLTADATTKAASGGIVRGTVVSESPTKVEVKLGNTVTAVPTNEVASIVYEGRPASFDQAVEKESANLLQEAADLFKKAAADSANKPFILEAALFGQARVMTEIALTDASRAAEATTLLEAFSRSYKNGRHVGPALESLAKLQIAKENYAGVESTLTAMGQLPKGDERVALLRIKVLASKGQREQAVTELDKVIAGAAEGSSKKRDAQLAKAENLVALKKYPEAEATVMTVIKAASAEDASTQAVAHNTLGDCLRAAGRPKDALNAYLHTDLLFSKEKDEHAKALAQIAQLWKELNRPDRAEETLERLKAEYPRSIYSSAK